MTWSSLARQGQLNMIQLIGAEGIYSIINTTTGQQTLIGLAQLSSAPWWGLSDQV